MIVAHLRSEQRWNCRRHRSRLPVHFSQLLDLARIGVDKNLRLVPPRGAWRRRKSKQMPTTLAFSAVVLAALVASASATDAYAEMSKCDAINVCSGKSGAASDVWCAGKAGPVSGCGNSDAASCETRCKVARRRACLSILSTWTHRFPFILSSLTLTEDIRLKPRCNKNLGWLGQWHLERHPKP